MKAQVYRAATTATTLSADRSGGRRGAEVVVTLRVLNSRKW